MCDNLDPFSGEPKLSLQFFREALRSEFVTLAQVNPEIAVTETIVIETLKPLHAARRHIRCGPAAFDFLQHLETHVRTLERDASSTAVVKPCGSKQLAFRPAHFPDMCATPLTNIGRVRQGVAEGVELGGSQCIITLPSRYSAGRNAGSRHSCSSRFHQAYRCGTGHRLTPWYHRPA